MKIKKTRLLQIIQEEISRINEEDKFSDLSLDALALAAKKDSDAMGPLIDRFQKKYKNLAFKFTKNEADAEEALQQTALIIMNNLNNFKAESSFGTWASSILRSVAVDAIRKGKRMSSFAGTPSGTGEASMQDISDASQAAGDDSLSKVPMGHIPGPEELLLRKERYGAFGDLLQAIEADEVGLSENEKAVFYNQLDDSPIPTKDLADDLGVSVGQIGTYSSRGRQKIVNWIENSEISSREKNKILSVFSGGVRAGDLREEMDDDLPPGLIPAKDDLRDSIRADVDKMHPGLQDWDQDVYEGLVDFMVSEIEAENDHLRQDDYLPQKGPEFKFAGYEDPEGFGKLGDLEEAIKEALKNLL